MTDLERFEALLSSANIGAIKSISAGEHGTVIQIQNTGKYGYTGFFSEWEFDTDGKLTDICHWE